MQDIISNHNMTEKINLLTPSEKETVYNFIDFLLSKNHTKKKDKKSLLNVSVWNDKDIEVIEEARKELNVWSLSVS